MRKRVRAGGDPKSLMTEGRFSLRKKLENTNTQSDAITVFLCWLTQFRLRKKSMKGLNMTSSQRPKALCKGNMDKSAFVIIWEVQISHIQQSICAKKYICTKRIINLNTYTILKRDIGKDN
jgi:hypothetical protein